MRMTFTLRLLFSLIACSAVIANTLSNPTITSLVISLFAVNLACLFATRRSISQTVSCSIASLGYVLFLWLAYVTATTIRYRAYSGKKPFFEDGWEFELLFLPLLLFVPCAIAAVTLGATIGWTASWVARRFEKRQEQSIEPKPVLRRW